jgi:hypothetical protein
MKKWITLGAILAFNVLTFSWLITSGSEDKTKDLITSRTATDLVPSVMAFVKQADLHNIDVRPMLSKLTITFVNLSNLSLANPSHYRRLYGYCFYYQGIVGIDRVIWDSNIMTDLEKEQLMMHELGHCVLGRVHDDSQQWNKEINYFYPKSFMNSWVLDESQIISQIDEFETELFDPTTFNQLGIAEVNDDEPLVTFNEKSADENKSRN